MRTGAMMVLIACGLGVLDARPAAADHRDGGCNAYGCWRNGGGCNAYGCWNSPWGECNAYGCSDYGGCNAYGCWHGRDGSCNAYGCSDHGGCNAYGCWQTPDGECNAYGCSEAGPCNAYGCPDDGWRRRDDRHRDADRGHRRDRWRRHASSEASDCGQRMIAREADTFYASLQAMGADDN